MSDCHSDTAEQNIQQTDLAPEGNVAQVFASF